MNAELKEFKNSNNQIVMAVIWIKTTSLNYSEMNIARTKLNDFINTYVGNQGHNIYLHTEKDSVSAIISFDLDNYPGQTLTL